MTLQQLSSCHSTDVVNRIMSSPQSSAVQKTTRICVKNIPPTFDESKLRRHLLESGPASASASNLYITDCRILKTKEGKSRKLAFVGFKTHDQALRAVEAFNGTYAKTSRLAVELAFSKKLSAGEAGHRPWSKHSKGSSRYDRNNKSECDTVEDKKYKHNVDKSKNVSENEKEIVDEELMRKKEEFLQVMGASAASTGGGKAKAWSNDAVGTLEKKKGSEVNDDINDDSDREERSDDDESSDDDDNSSDDSSVDSGGEGADALAGKGAAYAGAAVSDMDFLRAKTTQKDQLSDDDEEDVSKDEKMNDGQGSLASADSSSSAPSSSSDDDSDSDGEVEGAENSGEKDETVANDLDGESDTHTSDGYARDRLFVRNLPFSATEEEVKGVFDAYGEILECHIPVDDSKKNKGYAFVRFQSSNDALAARETLDGSDFQGRLMHVLPARKAREEDMSGGNSGDAAGTTYKQQQERDRQKGAENSTAGWSSSFVRGDAVIDNLSDRLGLAKGDILNVKEGLSSGGAAVRLALGETQIIEENREYFKKHGVNMDTLRMVSGTGKKGDDAKRSKELILVKNLPYDTTEDDLIKLFHGVGDAPARILLPPSRTIALVEYGHAVDARKAFRKLAYKRFKHVPLYLEWAPLAAREKSDANVGGNADLDKVENMHNDNDKADNDEHDDDNAASSHAIFVKNLNFKITEQQLLDAFKGAGHKARAVRIPTKLAPVKSSGRNLPGAEPEMKNLSMGFGFVEFDSEGSARRAMKKMQGIFLDGHALEIKLSGNKKATQGRKDTKAPSSAGLKSKKLMVRNVPFQATRKEILQLFGSYGHLKKVRLPKKFDGSHRGFAFVEFLTSQEAQNAMKALASTHLYGRHLVLEWADDKEDIDALREKAKRDAHHVGDINTGAPKNKKIRFD